MPIRGGSGDGYGLLATGQTVQYSDELDDGYYEKGKAKAFQVLSTGGYAGTVNVDLVHLVSDAISFDAATRTITCTGQMGVFKAAGGETIVVSGSASNDGVYTTASADANGVVVVEALQDEAAGATISIAKRSAKSNNCVLDLNTGLLWSRYVSNYVGATGTGVVPWTGVPYDAFAYAAAANAAQLAGFDDWRVPNLFELQSLYNVAAGAAGPDPTAFPSWPAGNAYVWTSTTNPYVTTNAFNCQTSLGSSGNRPKTEAYYVALVRGG